MHLLIYIRDALYTHAHHDETLADAPMVSSDPACLVMVSLGPSSSPSGRGSSDEACRLAGAYATKQRPNGVMRARAWE